MHPLSGLDHYLTDNNLTELLFKIIIIYFTLTGAKIQKHEILCCIKKN